MRDKASPVKEVGNDNTFVTITDHFRPTSHGELTRVMEKLSTQRGYCEDNAQGPFSREYPGQS